MSKRRENIESFWNFWYQADVLFWPVLGVVFAFFFVFFTTIYEAFASFVVFGWFRGTDFGVVLGRWFRVGLGGGFEVQSAFRVSRLRPDPGPACYAAFERLDLLHSLKRAKTRKSMQKHAKSCKSMNIMHKHQNRAKTCKNIHCVLEVLFGVLASVL